MNVVGYHGQTLFHNPAQFLLWSAMGSNWQTNSALPSLMTLEVVMWCTFAPLYHYALAVRDNKLPIAVVNCGGISNISLILNKNEESVIGFDTRSATAP